MLQKYESMKFLKIIHISIRKNRIITCSNNDITDISMITLDVHFFQNETFRGALENGIPENFKKVLCKTSLKRSYIVKKDLVTDTFLRFSLNIWNNFSMEYLWIVLPTDISFCRSCDYIPQLFQVKEVKSMTLIKF